ncbi:INCREASED PETAL GROWTH ANISOTROPY 1-like protein 1 [Cannabis sativa]|uniref:INCREASED PETAL GROWTH ANISOTROPY 1-like protein 1 n=1 Tax=Cannabis sativa TaxID=3483 RepID=UPI0029CA5892|nr:INCREASED PETAL GROWTH ANISOTROPY 1-like protein 1 [Cannabis sativa]XP_030508751.2 INCREASED PETAL GROWTH ANISOTROPY 1-like protein 1 [Cannabis sativa]XP_030508752.2 INCREASED PETAL GROWTH ANISOTROPY 1-like protein 1 [Cannabis sativa]
MKLLSDTTSSPHMSQTTTTTTTTTTTPSRLRAPSKFKDSPKPSRAKSVTPDANDNNSRPRRPLVLTKPKSGELGLGSQKGRELDESKLVGRLGNRPVVEQFSRPRRLRSSDVASSKKTEDFNNNNNNPDGKNKDLHDKLQMSDALIRDLQSQVLSLKTELDKAHGFNSELLSRNKKLAEELEAAEAKIASTSSPDQTKSVGKYQSPNFKDIQKLIANKLQRSVGKKETVQEASIVKKPSSPFPQPPPPPPPISPTPKVVDVARKTPSSMSVLPPPPPPPPMPSARTAPATSQKAPAFLEFYHSLTKQEGKKNSPELRKSPNHKQTAISAHNSIVGEIQNRSSHLLAIKADIETKGEFINGLIAKVLDASYLDIEDVLKFVDWLDEQLSSLADERAVLKHFKWPERKADALREAAIEYRELKQLENEIASYKDDTDIPCAAALKKITSLLDKSEKSIQRLIKLRNSAMRSYKEFKIPTDWMLDSGIVSKIKQASMNLVKTFMKRVTMEVESDKELNQESLLLQGVNFAYRAHQFAGGLDSETLCAFEEIRARFPGHMRGSRQLLTS